MGISVLCSSHTMNTFICFLIVACMMAMTQSATLKEEAVDRIQYLNCFTACSAVNFASTTSCTFDSSLPKPPHAMQSSLSFHCFLESPLCLVEDKRELSDWMKMMD